MNMQDPATRASVRFGWTFLALFLLGGLLLEGLHGIKAPWYLENELRRELWVLAHAHGALLALVNLVFAVYALPLIADEPRRRRAGLALRLGALLVPAGFFFGGIGNSESDPALLILLTPIGALLVLHAVTVAAFAAWRAPGAGGATPAPTGRLPRAKR